jgi:hypothetical protein
MTKISITDLTSQLIEVSGVDLDTKKGGNASGGNVSGGTSFSVSGTTSYSYTATGNIYRNRKSKANGSGWTTSRPSRFTITTTDNSVGINISGSGSGDVSGGGSASLTDS